MNNHVNVKKNLQTKKTAFIQEELDLGFFVFVRSQEVPCAVEC